MPPSPVLATVPVTVTGEDGTDTIKYYTTVIGAAQKEGGASSGIQAQEIKPTISSTRKRIYWFQESDD
jgi:hypothetical protein